MRAQNIVRYACYSLAVLLSLFSLWCLLWTASSYSMAFTDCAGTFDLFAQNSRCRQPSIAGLLASAGLLGAVVAVRVGRRFRV